MRVSAGGGGRTFPALGFDPAPGEVEIVDLLTQELGKAATTLGDGASRLRNISSSTGSEWTGQAADAFRAHAGDDLPKALENAHDSFAKAHSALSGWSADLAEYQRKADHLEAEAEQAKQALAQAKQNLASVKAHPYHVVGNDPTGRLAAEAAQKQQHAESEAGGAVSKAESELQDLIKRAHNLKGEHDAAASRVARQLEHAPDNLAPDKPGLLSRIGHWIKDHAGGIASILSEISAIASIGAMIPPLDVVCVPLAAATAVAAAGFHALDGDWKSAGLDLVGAVPGVKALTAAAKTADAVDTVRAAAELAPDVKSVGDAAYLTKESLGAAGDTLKGVPDAIRGARGETNSIATLAGRGLSKLPGVTADAGKLSANVERTMAGVGFVHSTMENAHGIDEDLPAAPGGNAAKFGLGAYDLAGDLVKV